MDLLGGYDSDSGSDSCEKVEDSAGKGESREGSVNTNSGHNNEIESVNILSGANSKNVDVTTREKLKLLRKYEEEFGSLESSSPATTITTEKIKEQAKDVCQKSSNTQQNPENNWKEAFDPKSKKPYYYNVKTGETSWTMPGSQTSQQVSEVYSKGVVGSRKRPLSAISSFDEVSKQPTGRHLERILNKNGDLESIKGMDVINQSEVLDSVQAAEKKDITVVEAPRIKTKMWSVEQGGFVTSSVASKVSRNKNSIQALASQAILAQNALEGNYRKPGKSLRQSRAKYGW